MTWEYFSYKTDPMLACPCCGEEGMDQSFMEDLDAFREDCGFSFIVASGYRCPEYNNQISSTGPSGPHTTGRAIDIRVSGINALRMLYRASEYGMTGVGVSQKGSHGSRFLHFDQLTPEEAPRPWIWSY